MRSLRQLMSLKGRAAVVTGGAGHIGSVFCESLAELGADVAVLDLSAPACREVAARIARTCGVRAIPLAVDISRDAAARSVPRRVLSRLGRLDILVNCAAMVGTSRLQGWVSPFDEQSSSTWRKALETNLTAPFVLTQACAKALAASGHGSVINIGSLYGLLGPDMSLYAGTKMGNPAAYSAGKGGLLQFTRWLATVLAPRIRVNSITPGGIERGQPPSFQRRFIRRTPLNRMSTEEDLKGAVAYLASDLSAYVTGQNLVVDGGWTAW